MKQGVLSLESNAISFQVVEWKNFIYVMLRLLIISAEQGFKMLNPPF